MKKIVKIVIAVVVILSIGLGVFYVLNKSDKNTTLSILEKQWIEDNKNTMQDFAILNDIPIYNHDGAGIIYDFLQDLEETTGLEFNKMTYAYGKESPSKYSFAIKNKKAKNDILIEQDNYVLVTKENKKIVNLDEITDMTIGVEKDKMSDVDNYLNINNKNSLTSYNNIEEMIEEFKNDKTKLTAIVIPKKMYLDDIIENKFYINYNITEMTLDYVITLGDNTTLNNIIKKYYEKWNNENYKKLYGKYFTNEYFESSNINNDSQVKFASKQYKYGFVNLKPYDQLINNKLIGTNTEIIKKFTDISEIEILYTEYSDIASLLKAFNDKKVDFIFNNNSNEKYSVKTKETVSPYEEKIVVISHNKNNKVINSIKSIDYAYTIKNTKISNYLEKNKIETKQYKNINTLLSKINQKSILVMDYDTYNVYKNKELKDYEIRTTFNLDSDYNYIFNGNNSNDTFYKYFDFYLSFADSKNIIEKVNYKDFVTESNNAIIKNILIIVCSLLSLGIITIIIKIVKNNKKTIQGVSKEDKLKYIDMLTSLKNRNYLNDHIEKWDDSQIYPQTIIIVDLNNVAYINDNYGHSEGDNVITEAANILIRNQLEQTEIIRTNGNEFLIYLVGYEEKQIITYKRKLTKEFKELSHGFGAAIGYSMITDGLKTIDDAINEATLDMKANKEETEN